MQEPRSVVSLRRWQAFGQLEDVLDQCIADLGGMAKHVRPGQTVVIKPNLTANAPSSSGGTTHVELVEAIVRRVQRCHPARVLVAEATSSFGTTLETAFPTGGWREMAQRTGAELCNLDAGPHVEEWLENSRYPGAIPFSQLILTSDVFITVPCLKTHISADYTVALKNSYALTPQWKRSEIHRQFLLEEALVDLNRIRKPDLTIVDGWDGAEGIAGGNKFDRPAGARVMIAGVDPVAVDVVSRAVMAFTPKTRYLDWAIEDGVGCGDMDAIALLGDALEDCRHPFMSPAEEVCSAMPGVAVHDLAACSGCRIPALKAIYRFVDQKVLSPLVVCFGVEGSLPADATLCIGDCTPEGGRARRVAGCPAQLADILAALEATGSICLRCVGAVRDALAGWPTEALAELRIAAAGDEVFSGSRVDRNGWHLELIVGGCMERYVRTLRQRADQFSMDRDEDILWLEGCPPDQAAVETALTHLSQRMAARG